MKTFFLKKPREYEVGIKSKTIIKDVGKISLDSDEQITFVDSSDNEYDLQKKIGVIMQHLQLIKD